MKEAHLSGTFTLSVACGGALCYTVGSIKPAQRRAIMSTDTEIATGAVTLSSISELYRYISLTSPETSPESGSRAVIQMHWVRLIALRDRYEDAASLLGVEPPPWVQFTDEELLVAYLERYQRE